MSRELVFKRIRQALQNGGEDTSATGAPSTWEYGRPTAVADPIGLFIERIKDYRAVVLRTPGVEEVPLLIASCLAKAQATSVVVPVGFDEAWIRTAALAGIELYRDEPPLSKQELDGISAVVTTATSAMAETGTIALDHRSGQGRRILTLLPDTHVCVIRIDQIVSDVPESMALLKTSIQAGLPITLISGPSATSDIELTRVEGVHGPRNLYVIVVG
ncbi:MAG: LUD domain-containing protein [Coriobacteriales bacterium]|jgi:L-lactate dehydrogenase complex protein LldG|nr:LUD domain-containing protein [Coriobacteriales bacterium]